MDDGSDMDPDMEREMEEQVSEWSSNSNDVFNITLLDRNGDEASTFSPEFTYPFFGEEEAIFGYQGLAINLTFAAHDMRPRIKLSWDKKFQDQGDIQATDIENVLEEHIPGVAWSDHVDIEDAATFAPPGEQIHSYRRGGRKYEIWSASLDNPVARKIMEHVMPLVPMFIEGGTQVDLGDDEQQPRRWKLHLLYEVADKTGGSGSPYSLVGFGTSYRVFAFPDRRQPAKKDVDLLRFDDAINAAIEKDVVTLDMLLGAQDRPTNPLDLPSRERISQFLILEPYQKSGHGQELYNAMYTHLTTPSNIRELSIEDPNESFDELRDLADLRRLRSTVPAFAALRIHTSIPAADLTSTSQLPIDLIVPIATRTSIRQQTKMDSRQFDRLVEMHTLSFIPESNRSRNRITRKEKSTNEHDRAYFFWRMYVKYRLFIFNRDQLIQLEGDERVASLESTVDAVQAGYEECLDRVAKAGEYDGDSVAGAGSHVKKARKRKVVDDDSEEEEEDEAVVVDGSNGTKKRRAV